MKSAELRVLCEGATEATFVKKVLAPHLSAHRVFVKRVEDLHGIKKFDALRKAIKNEIGLAKAHQYITTMFDLYALPDYPGDPRREGIRGAPRAVRIEAAMAEELPSPQFYPYIQVHEFEALVFVDLDQLLGAFPDGEAKGAPAALRRSVAGLEPEDIDDGQDTAPSKRLGRVIPAYSALKSVAGPEIAARIGLPRLRAACPHFHEWVTTLERMAQDGLT